MPWIVHTFCVCVCVEKVDRQFPRTSGGRLLSEVGAAAAFASLLPPQNGLLVKS